MDYSVILGPVGGAAGAAVILLITKISEIVRARRAQGAEIKLEAEKQQATLALPANEQAVSIYKELVLSLRTDLTTLVTNSKAQEKEVLDCHEERINLRAAVSSAATERTALMKRVDELEGRIATQEKK